MSRQIVYVLFNGGHLAESTHISLSNWTSPSGQKQPAEQGPLQVGLVVLKAGQLLGHPE